MTETASNVQERPVTPVDVPVVKDETPQANGHQEEDAAAVGDEPPAKKRRVGETTPKSKPLPKKISPPWKAIKAEIPTRLEEDGKRRSGRQNHKPVEPEPPADKRQTRGVPKDQNGTSSGTNPLNARDIPRKVNGSAKFNGSSPLQSPKSAAKAATAVPKRSHHRKSLPVEQTAPVTTFPVKRSHKKKVPALPATPQSAPPASTRSPKARRQSRLHETQNVENVAGLPASNPTLHTGPTPNNKLSRIKFRVRAAELPLTSYEMVVQRPSRHATLKEFLEQESTLPVEQGGLYTPEDANEYDAETIAKDAQIILRLEKATEPGGVLSPSRCSVYKPEAQEQPPQQYAHLDHLNRAAIEFRRLMVMEQKKHRLSAKRLAEACRDEWLRKQPKSSEQLEADVRKTSLIRYKQLVKSLQGTWDNVRAEVNRRRLLEWQAQEKERVRQALNDVVDISTQKLEARRAQRDSEMPSDEDEEEGTYYSGEDGEGSEHDYDDEALETTIAKVDDDEGNMSSSESEADDELTHSNGENKAELEDENLTVEQLREKYSSLPDIPLAKIDEDMPDANDLEKDQEGVYETSDESTDMDDDMGDSDEERDDDDESSEDEAETGILGMLAPAELDAAKVVDEDNQSDDYVVVNDSESTPVDLEDSTALEVVINGQTPALDNKGVLIELGRPVSEPPRIQVPSSPDRTSPTPQTSETKMSEDNNSVSSLDHQSRQVTKSITPQPSNGLKTPVPFLLRGTLREYQHFGLDWLARLYSDTTNGILADEMGLGKTIQTIALLAHLAVEYGVWGPHLVIVPTSVMLNWEMEFKKFLPGFKILTYYGTQEERKRKRHGWKADNSWNVIITSYQLVLQDKQVFRNKAWHYMILDEAHNIKNFESQRWQTMLTFNTRARLLLTGTPLQNNLTELWSLLFFLTPSDGTGSGFSDLRNFKEMFGAQAKGILENGTMTAEDREVITKLHTVLRPYLLRRLKADVEKQMPGKFEHVEWCRLSKRQRELYDGFLSRDDTRGILASGNYLSIINCLMQLRKVCNHPDLFIERAIMTSFPMEKSVASDYETKELLVRRRLLREEPMSNVSLEFLNLVPTKHENLSKASTNRVHLLSAQKALMDARESQRSRAQSAFTNLDPSTAKSNLVYLESASRWGRFEELQHCVYLNALRRQQKPIYGTRLVEFLTLGISSRPLRPQPKRRSEMLLWLENSSPTLTSMIPTISSRSEELNTTIQKFACVTPPVIARDMAMLSLSPKMANTFQSMVSTSERDPFHEARMRLSIQFPDKRLLQYDCGKLQTLAKLLRKLQAQGSRALIFTQMTKVLDILEQFLNIHGYKYLRLDGSTKVEQRQALTDRFNNDDRILVFILSSRSGGLGINLTGADTVIFYDLDWNPAMDKQCQDRAHRIGQTRDVHIYRLVSEHTIEANILRKANQKRMLDDVVIQEGGFTTDYFNKSAAGDDSTSVDDDDAAAIANAAMDRVLGGPDGNVNDVSRVLACAEDKEDVAAAGIAEREIVQTDAADFDENAVVVTGTPAGVGTPLEGVPGPLPGPADSITPGVEEEEELDASGRKMESTDEYMLKFMIEQLKDTPVEIPRDKNRSKRGRDRRRIR